MTRTSYSFRAGGFTKSRGIPSSSLNTYSPIARAVSTLPASKIECLPTKFESLYPPETDFGHMARSGSLPDMSPRVDNAKFRSRGLYDPDMSLDLSSLDIGK